MTAFLAGCEALPPIRLQLGAGDIARPIFDGLIAADEPEAVLAARNILLGNGNAVDAAVALGFTLSVTMPSSAGLGGGGACLVHDAASGVTEALDFTARAGGGEGAARFRAAVPALGRGLFALHAKYGKVPWPQVVAPAENLARFGHTVSRAFARDLVADGEALMNDRTALATFMTPSRQMLAAGDSLKQIDLATTLSRMRTRGPHDLYNGPLARDLEDAVAAAGGAITVQDMRGFIPRWVAATSFEEGGVRVYGLPSDIGGGGLEESFKAGGVSLAQEQGASGSTGFVVADAGGSVVACALSMGRAFGLGIMPAGTGFILAPAPDAPGGKPLLSAVAGIGRTNDALLFAAATAGADAVAQMTEISRALVKARFEFPPPGPASVKRAGLINVLTCSPAENTCQARNDPRGAGYAVTLRARD
jgi:gamma-glutamyltranspeptidase/glutathione hydrolase